MNTIQKAAKETILVLGNGFDIGSGYPTKYLDFIRFEQVIKEYILADNLSDSVFEKYGLDDKIVQKIKEYTGQIRATSCLDGNIFMQKSRWRTILDNNFWLQYFENCSSIGEGWIDFEGEMTRVIGLIDALSNGHEDDSILEVSSFQNNGLGLLTSNIFSKKAKLVKSVIKDMLIKDLDNLRIAFEIYLLDYATAIHDGCVIPEIARIAPTKVLCFNYTDTYQKIYDDSYGNVEYSYIHGRALPRRTKQKDNLVLGINEYLNSDAKDNDLFFVDFKKYYQRLIFQCSRRHETWTNDIRTEDMLEKEASSTILEGGIEYECLRNSDSLDYNEYKRIYNEKKEAISNERIIHDVIFYGHSMGESDKDILRKLILNDNVHVLIYYYDYKAYCEIIKNLIKVIGQDELIARTGDNRVSFKEVNKAN